MYRSYARKDRLRICVIAFMYHPHVGGAEAQAEKQALELKALGHDVMVVTLQHEKVWKQHEIVHGIPVTRIGGIFRHKGRLRSGKIWQIPIELALFLTLLRLRNAYHLRHV